MVFALVALILASGGAGSTATAQQDERPNILVIFGDDVGFWNISKMNHGMMGYRTPNIDRIANEGIYFTDYYAEQSCTAGRASFITGQIPVRTGLTKVGMPGAEQGLQAEDPTIAELLKPLGYRTGQFGKNHLGDRDEHLPTAHGFDEFFGNLYHLNMEEEPELPDWPSELTFKDGSTFDERYAPRGVIHSYADGRLEDTGPLTKKRMETADQEFVDASQRFIRDAVDADEPFFVWLSATRMHVFTHLAPEAQGVTGQGIYPDGMVEHDGHVGQMLDLLDELGISEDTIVLYSTDNGAEVFTWPDGGTTPFKGEKATTWEGGFRVPAMIRWPGKIPAGSVSNGIVHHMDWLPTMVAAAGEPEVKEKLLAGHQAGEKNFNVHLDGYDLTEHLASGGMEPSPRSEVFYFTDTGELSAVRHNNYKVMFSVQEAHGFDVWKNPMTPLAWPHLFNLRADPFERAHEESIGWAMWATSRMFALTAAQGVTMDFLSTFVDYPPRQEPGSFSVDAMLEKLQSSKADARSRTRRLSQGAPARTGAPCSSAAKPR
ncbi:MAG: sulfatase-like hydrolase/transferase [Acidobacteria bacterium]|nr:sulfatase-like hydrolase/transferase [Acidobacteriota bacterium]